MWKVGQEIVCIKTHSQSIVKRGQTFIIKGVREPICDCTDLELDVGIKSGILGVINCTYCNKRDFLLTNAWWISEELFAPLEYNADAIKELIEEPISV